jgi:hypothetical protein
LTAVGGSGLVVGLGPTPLIATTVNEYDTVGSRPVMVQNSVPVVEQEWPPGCAVAVYPTDADQTDFCPNAATAGHT